jgi:hypothetical protein
MEVDAERNNPAPLTMVLQARAAASRSVMARSTRSPPAIVSSL